LIVSVGNKDALLEAGCRDDLQVLRGAEARLLHFPARGLHDKLEVAEGQAGVGNGESSESTTAQAVAMLESDEPEVDDMGELDGTIVDDLEGSIGEGGDLESQLDAACDAAFGEGQAVR
jgi:hypothetical protein